MLTLFQVSPKDFLEGRGDEDLCAAGGDAYTSNQMTQHPGGEEEEYSLSYLCPKAFDLEQPMRLSDLDCEDFKFDNGRYVGDGRTATKGLAFQSLPDSGTDTLTVPLSIA